MTDVSEGTGGDGSDDTQRLRRSLRALPRKDYHESYIPPPRGSAQRPRRRSQRRSREVAAGGDTDDYSETETHDSEALASSQFAASSSPPRSPALASSSSSSRLFAAAGAWVSRVLSPSRARSADDTPVAVATVRSGPSSPADTATATAEDAAPEPPHLGALDDVDDNDDAPQSPARMTLGPALQDDNDGSGVHAWAGHDEPAPPPLLSPGATTLHPMVVIESPSAMRRRARRVALFADEFDEADEARANAAGPAEPWLIVRIMRGFAYHNWDMLRLLMQTLLGALWAGARALLQLVWLTLRYGVLYPAQLAVDALLLLVRIGGALPRLAAVLVWDVLSRAARIVAGLVALVARIVAGALTLLWRVLSNRWVLLGLVLAATVAALLFAVPTPPTTTTTTTTITPTTTAVPPVAVPTSAPVVQPTDPGLARRMAELEDELARLRAAFERLPQPAPTGTSSDAGLESVKLALETLQRDVAEQLRAMHASISKTDGRSAALTQQLRDVQTALSADMDKIKDSVAQLSSAAASAKTDTRMTNEELVAYFDKQVTQLAQRLETQLRAQHAQGEQRLRDELRQLSAQLEPPSSAPAASLADDLARLREDMLARIDRAGTAAAAQAASQADAAAQRSAAAVEQRLTAAADKLRERVEAQASAWQADVQWLQDAIAALRSAGQAQPGVPAEIVARLDQLAEALQKAATIDDVHKALRVYDADRIGQADHALFSNGGRVRAHSRSFAYSAWTLAGMTAEPPTAVLQPAIESGRCWAMAGSQGFVEVDLAYAIVPSAFTIDHVPRATSVDKTRASAPRDMTVQGVGADGVAVDLISFAYDIASAEHIQTFAVPARAAAHGAFATYRLVVGSNHGHPGFTCIYRWRVHGERLSQAHEM